ELEAAAAAPVPISSTPPSRTSGRVAPSGPTREKRVVSLLTFRADGGHAAALHDLIRSVGGTLARGDGCFAVVFDRELGDNPGRVALSAAREVVVRGIAGAAFLDTAQVSMVPRRDGSRRYVSSRFDADASFPADGAADGVLASADFAQLFTDLHWEAVGERFRLRRAAA